MNIYRTESSKFIKLPNLLPEASMLRSICLSKFRSLHQRGSSRSNIKGRLENHHRSDRRAAVRETSVSQHHRGQIEGPLETPWPTLALS